MFEFELNCTRIVIVQVKLWTCIARSLSCHLMLYGLRTNARGVPNAQRYTCTCSKQVELSNVSCTGTQTTHQFFSYYCSLSV